MVYTRSERLGTERELDSFIRKPICFSSNEEMVYLFEEECVPVIEGTRKSGFHRIGKNSYRGEKDRKNSAFYV